ncbi:MULTISPECIES: class I SAM-dependent methyltransferase [unclassified Streptomyces]|uniref:class I SAM-dependent methyltransferase n=1 Tax=unclassified Streptomyces TaxID=2593676 RepID=UPI00056CE76E|nr:MULTISPECIES: class I SAM-dependent methyltransferase [unclassified Streptomyces]
MTDPAASDDPEELVRYATAAADRRVGAVDPRQVGDFVRQLDEAVLGSMLGALQGAGVLTDPGCVESPEQVITAVRVAPQHHVLIRRWLRVLADREVIERDGAGFRGVPPLDPHALDRAWDRAAATWQRGLGSAEFIDYLRENARRLPELMTGEQQAALLLFPEGRSHLADAVYRDTVTARYLNTAVGRAVSALATGRDASRPLRIVEVGAGTGATTDAVVAALTEGPERTPPVDYLFTDVSHFFVGAAQERFSDQRWIRYGHYDIDQDPAAQGLAPGCADVVIAAGVLNNARNTDTTVRAIAGLLAPGGWLFLTEPTREHLEILASQSFMMTAADDTRQDSDTTFLSRRQWLDALTGAGFDRIATAPDEDHPLAPLGQRLFAARVGRPIASSGATSC